MLSSGSSELAFLSVLFLTTTFKIGSVIIPILQITKPQK